MKIARFSMVRRCRKDKSSLTAIRTATSESLVNQVTAIPNVRIADEAEEVIGNAAAGWGESDLFFKQLVGYCRGNHAV
jgi:hypothetical protein